MKFLEIAVLCFSNRALPGLAAGSQAALRMQKKEDAKTWANDFSLEDLPLGYHKDWRELFFDVAGLGVVGGAGGD